MGSVGALPTERHVELAYTDGYSIEYLGRKLRAYWQRNGMTEGALLSTAENEYLQLEKRGVSFDEETMSQMEKAGGAGL